MNKRYKRYVIILAIIVLVLNVLAWLSRPFCDWYIKYVFVIWLNTYGRLTNLFPFSVGEIMLCIAFFIIFASLVIGVITLFRRNNKRYLQFVKTYYKVLLVVILNVCLIMTLNCTMLYHCTRIDPNNEYEKRAYTIDELEKMYTYIVNQCNFYAEKMNRDEDGYIIYDESIDEQSRLALRNLAKDYPRLKGYYPHVKKMLFSGLMSQAHLCGYFFPFSMEANTNSYMYIVNYPATYCHELSHLHGYIYEDEANFIGYLACVKSDDDLFKYSGYMSVVWYVRDAYINSISMLDEAERNHRIDRMPRLSKLAKRDDIFLRREDMEKVKSNAIINTDIVNSISDGFTDMSLKANGVAEGSAAYGRVVDLLLQYYEGILY